MGARRPIKLGDGTAAEAPARPLHKLKYLLEPRSVAVVGVSRNMNPGQVILDNLLRNGFDRDRILVVKPGAESIDGCACVPDIASLPERVDVIVLAIDASQAAGAVAETIERRAAECTIVIPGGFEEKAGAHALVRRMHESLAASCESDWEGPLINGGNCLGIQSRPGRYDTLFIPEHKIGVETCVGGPIAFISQSGAFAVSKNSKLAALQKKYTITIGNQMDVTIGDYMSHLKDDAEIAVYAVYAEGFKPLDGMRFLEAAREITDGGRTVVLYRAGRTSAGAKASASHTASIAGDYAVTRELARAAGVTVAESIADFEDLVVMSEEGYERAVRALLSDESVDVAVIACVPLTPALNSLAAGPGHDEDVASERSIASRAASESPKACVAVVDGGVIHNAMARVLLRSGIPTFRTADRALRLLGALCEGKPTT